MDHEFREPPEKKPRLTTQSINETDFSQDVLENDNEFTVKENLKEFVSPEELDKLREFKVLDETKSNDEDSNDEDSDSSDGQPIADEEIEKMLEENLPDNLKGAPKPKDRPYVTVSKTVLEEKGVNHFEVLPLDWMVIQHYSGMPLYMHRTTRVCTLSKPYFLGKGNARRHEIPLSAIPCLAYRRALEEEEKQKEIDKRIQEQIRKQKQANEDKNKTNEKSSNEAVNLVKNGLSKSYVDESLGNKKSNNLLLNRSKCPYNKQSDNIVCDAKFRINSDNVIDRDKVDDSITKLNDYKVLQDNLKNDIEMAMLDIQKTREIINKDVKCDESNKEFNGINENHDNTSHQAVIIGKDQIKQEREDVQENEDENETNVEEAPDEIVNKNNENVDANNENVDANNENVDANNENVDANNENVDTNNEKEGNEDNLDDAAFSQRLVTLPGGIVMAPPRVETVGKNLKKQYLTPEQLNDYCKKLFKFKVIKLMHFKRWAERRKYYKARNRKTLQFPALSEGTKLITIPMQHNSQENGGKPTKRDWVLSMNGLSYLSVFHEYVGRALKTQPVYEFKNLENAATPYQATVYISGMQYGVGFGSSKRQAKAAAARASVHILIPEMKDELDAHDTRAAASANDDTDFSFFDHVGILDPRIMDFCAATCEPSPHAILKTCLLRNFGTGDRHIHIEMKKLEYQKVELTMKVGKHSATVACKNKKTAKQRASQSILQALHPHVRSWGSLLRLYGSKSVKSCKEKKQEEQQITLLQDKARHNEPNYAVLEKLKSEMRKLRERDGAIAPIGTFLLTDCLPTHSNSNLNNVEL